ncbi:HbrB-like protein, partial [Mrakia frigida]|uniref:HbrB-like protein n=1 Tax=Mrakia frigida TaxID=29902 RepID=UPI003FCBF755
LSQSVLPLFNGSPLHSPLEDLNSLVATHIKSTLSRLPNNPSRAFDVLTNDLRELIASGMLTLDQKVQNVEDEKLVARIVSTWTFFFSAVV